ncbi:MAG: DUF2955 domain-containing protein [Gammaproteobacteria bacterium]
MPTETTRTLAQQRIIRFAVGTAIALWFSQAFGWPFSFLAAVFAATFLGLPLPAPGLKGGIMFMLILAAAMGLGLAMLLPLNEQPLAGVTLLTLLFFGLFYYGLRGGSPLVAALATAGLAAIPVVGAISIPAAVAVAKSLMVAGGVAMLAMWLAHAIFPDPPRPAGPMPAARPAVLPDSRAAARLAVRSTLVVMPVILWLLASGNLAYIAVALKVASLGQQASTGGTRQAGRDLLVSTAIGGVAAVAIWMILTIWPSLLIYTLLTLLCGLILGRRIFAGPAFAPGGQVYSYAVVTMLIILGPAVMDSGDAAGGRLTERILMFAGATVYAVFAVAIFDAVIKPHAPAKERHSSDPAESGATP